MSIMNRFTIIFAFALSIGVLAQTESLCIVDGAPELDVIFPLTTPYDEVVLNVSLVCNGTLTPSDVTLPDSASLIPFKFKVKEDTSDPSRLVVTLKFGCYVEADGLNLTVPIEFIDSAGIKYPVVFNLAANIQFDYTLSAYLFPPSLGGLTHVYSRAPNYSTATNFTALFKAHNPDFRSHVKTDLTFLAVIPSAASGVDPYNLTMNPTPLDPSWPAAADAYFETDNDTLVIIVDRTVAPEVDNLGWTYVFGVTISDKISSSYLEKYFAITIVPDTVPNKPCFISDSSVTKISVPADSGPVPLRFEATCPEGSAVVSLHYLFDFKTVYVESLVQDSESLLTMSVNLYQDAPLNTPYKVTCTFTDSTGALLEKEYVLTRFARDPSLARSQMMLSLPGQTGAAPLPSARIFVDPSAPKYLFGVSLAPGNAQSDAAATITGNITFVSLELSNGPGSAFVSPPLHHDFPADSCLEWLYGAAGTQKFALNPTNCPNSTNHYDLKFTLQTVDGLFLYDPQVLSIRIGKPDAEPSTNPHASPTSGGSPSPGNDKKGKGHGKKVAVVVVVVLLLLLSAAIGGALFAKRAQKASKQTELEQGYTNLE